MKLSKRLEMVASFVEEGSRIADVGTDHGYIPIVLIQRNQAQKAIAMDVRPGPLERARHHIAERGLEGRIETRLGDGLEKLAPGEAETVIIAGMGGELVIHIMEEGRRLWGSVDHWILSPHSEPGKVRHYLTDHGFVIAREDMTREDGKYYTVMEAVRGTAGQSGPGGKGCETKISPELEEAGYLYGARLIEAKHPVLLEFLLREESQIKEIADSLKRQGGGRAAARKRELAERLSCIRAAIEDIRGGQENAVQ